MKKSSETEGECKTIHSGAFPRCLLDHAKPFLSEYINEQSQEINFSTQCQSAQEQPCGEYNETESNLISSVELQIKYVFQVYASKKKAQEPLFQLTMFSAHYM